MSIFQIVRFFTDYDFLILPATFLVVWVFGLVNWGKNVYRRQNKQLELCRANAASNPKFVGVYVARIPEDYRRQWRAYVNSNAARPSQVFEFVPRKNYVKAPWIFVVSAVVSLIYAAIFVTDLGAHRDYLVFQVAFWLAFVVVMIVDSLIFDRKQRRARQIFGKFVAQLNAITPKGAALWDKTASQKINVLKKHDVSEFSLDKAAEILRENGLENVRTVEEQRDINTALNGLLQAYANSAPKSCETV